MPGGEWKTGCVHWMDVALVHSCDQKKQKIPTHGEQRNSKGNKPRPWVVVSDIRGGAALMVPLTTEPQGDNSPSVLLNGRNRSADDLNGSWQDGGDDEDSWALCAQVRPISKKRQVSQKGRLTPGSVSKIVRQCGWLFRPKPCR